MRLLYVFVVGLVPATLADGFEYEGDARPEQAGWSVAIIWCGPEEWIDAGWFHQHVDLCPGDEPPGGQYAVYRRSLADLTGAPDFFAEWSVSCDAPRTELFPWAGGAAVAIAGSAGVHYNAYIVRDRAWLHRDNLLPFVFVDLEPTVSHTFRLELRGLTQYTWFVDGHIVDEGVPEGPFPSGNPEILFQSYAAWVPSTTRWDYIRYGTISPPIAPGDTNCDDAINFFDVDPFVLALLEPAAYETAYPDCDLLSADLDGNELVNFFDIDPFVECLFGACP
jgi:hypothetical protein